MVVDDSEAIRALIKNMLLPMGYTNVYEACDGKEALALVESLHKKGVMIDLMIVDWLMPIMSGIDLLFNLKGNKLFKKIPFLMLTSQGDTESVITAIVLGVNDFMVKPFDQNMLSGKMSLIWMRLTDSSEK